MLTMVNITGKSSTIATRSRSSLLSIVLGVKGVSSKVMGNVLLVWYTE
jgi:hypothetical protein